MSGLKYFSLEPRLCPIPDLCAHFPSLLDKSLGSLFLRNLETPLPKLCFLGPPSPHLFILVLVTPCHAP